MAPLSGSRGSNSHRNSILGHYSSARLVVSVVPSLCDPVTVPRADAVAPRWRRLWGVCGLVLLATAVVDLRLSQIVLCTNVAVPISAST